MTLSVENPTGRVSVKPTRIRDPRLDFFRGLGMFIILIAHIPWNDWTNWIPARFGFSDAADMFVFCSGMASSIAFGQVFIQRGWWLGTARIAFRVWQVYWAHICSFFVVVAALAAADAAFGGQYYINERLELGDFFVSGAPHLLALMTLTYVPNYFDILPMYLVILVMVPMIMGLHRINPVLVPICVLGLWIGANLGLLDLVADPSTKRSWFFNPFGWQLIFFTGFAFVRGWLPAPPRNMSLVALSILMIVLAAPFSCQSEFQCYAGYGFFPRLGQIHEALQPLTHKTHYGPLRYLHFLATAYLAYFLAGERGINLRGTFAEITRKVGQQTLAVFLSGLLIGQLMGIVLDRLGQGFIVTAAVNILGCTLLIAAAWIVAWFKNPPWNTALRSATLVATQDATETAPITQPSSPNVKEYAANDGA